MSSTPIETPIESVVILSRALDQTGDVLAGVHEDQLSGATPCGDWDVGRLVAHVVAAPGHFLEMAQGGRPDWSAEPATVETGWAAAFRSAADDLIHFWHQAGPGADAGQVDWETAELAVHTWDLVRATGQRVHLDDRIAERGLAFMQASLTAENRGAAFGPEVPAPDEGSAYDRLAAFAGRHPT
jgi:uncharacterized protein (TIGR03086 family)